MTRNPFSAILAALAVALCATTAVAQEATITVKKSDVLNIALKPFSGSEALIAGKTVANDLDLSGAFALGAPERATYTVTGSASGGTLQGAVTDNRGSVVLQKTYSGNTRAAAHEFSDDIVETLTGAPGIATSKIAFVSNRTGAKEIYVADYDGANMRQITNDRAISVAPAISPEGGRLAYTGYQSGYSDIYLVELASGARSRILKFPGTNSGASFSPDGGRLACTLSRDGNPELYIAAVNGSGARRLTRTRGVESSPAWSPDGAEIVYSSDERGGPQLYRIGASSPPATAIAPNRAGRPTAGKSHSRFAKAALPSRSWTSPAEPRASLHRAKTPLGVRTPATSSTATAPKSSCSTPRKAAARRSSAASGKFPNRAGRAEPQRNVPKRRL